MIASDGRCIGEMKKSRLTRHEGNLTASQLMGTQIDPDPGIEICKICEKLITKCKVGGTSKN